LRFFPSFYTVDSRGDPPPRNCFYLLPSNAIQRGRPRLFSPLSAGQFEDFLTAFFPQKVSHFSSFFRLPSRPRCGFLSHFSLSPSIARLRFLSSLTPLITWRPRRDLFCHRLRNSFSIACSQIFFPPELLKSCVSRSGYSVPFFFPRKMFDFFIFSHMRRPLNSWVSLPDLSFFSRSCCSAHFAFFSFSRTEE